jgi:phosphatidylethanolamine/phosphatidyl-N-methylethanolamine N-methyltransferase
MSANAIGYGSFLRGLLNDPKAVSAPTPSSRALSRAIAEAVDMERPGIVVELGPGTGAVTQALLDRGVTRERLITIECEPSFVRALRQNFPGVTVHAGNALEFEKFIPAGACVATVVSGIPLLNLPKEMRASFVRRALSLKGNRRVIQLSYGWFPPVPAWPAVAVSRRVMWRNFPPALVWTYDLR